MPINFIIKDGQLSVECDETKRFLPVETTELENDVLKEIFGLLPDDANVHLERRTSSYLSIVAGQQGDFFRLKVTPKAKWFSINMAPIKKHQSDALAANVENTKQVHWKVYFDESTKFSDYKEWLIESYENNKNY